MSEDVKVFLAVLLGLLFGFFLAWVPEASAKRLNKEVVYQNHFCGRLEKSVTEYRLPDKTRVDCINSSYAIEVDFADKWAEGYGQATYYAKSTDRKPGIVLIVEDMERDMKYVERLIFILDPRYTLWLINQDKEIIRMVIDYEPM